MKQKVNYHVIQKMREQYKYHINDLRNVPTMLAMVEYETILWERYLGVSLRGDNTKKGVFPNLVDLTLYRKVKEAWTARLAQEPGSDGKS